MPPSVLQRDIFSFNSDKNRISLQSTYDNINMDTSLSSTQSQILGEPVSAEIYSIVDTTKDSFNFLSTLFKLFSSIHSNWYVQFITKYTYKYDYTYTHVKISLIDKRNCFLGQSTWFSFLFPSF